MSVAVEHAAVDRLDPLHEETAGQEETLSVMPRDRAFAARIPGQAVCAEVRA